MNKRIGYSSIIKIDTRTMQLLNLKENYCLVCVPGELIEKHNVKAFDIILDDDIIKMVAQSAKAELTQSNPTISKRSLS